MARIDPELLKPFYLKGNRTGVLLLHGLEGFPGNLRLFGEYLAKKGFTVSCPLLPGHSTSAEDLSKYYCEDWAEEAETAFQELKLNCDKVFVGGLSLGGLLSLFLARSHPDIRGVILINTPISYGNIPLSIFMKILPIIDGFIDLIRHFIFKNFDIYLKKYRIISKRQAVNDPQYKLHGSFYDKYSLHAYAELNRFRLKILSELFHINQPMLIFNSLYDIKVSAESPKRIKEMAASKEVNAIYLKKSWHVATVDYEKELIFDKSFEFIGGHL